MLTENAAPSAENSQVHSSPGPSARTVDPAKSPFSFELHSYRLEQLAKSPGEGFLFHGRPMFNGTGVRPRSSPFLVLSNYAGAGEPMRIQQGLVTAHLVVCMCL